MLFFHPDIHRRVLDQEVDVPSQRPVFELPIDRVGIAAKTVWVRLPEGRIPFTARLSVRLAGERRGIHMSRIEEAISRLADRQFTDLAVYAEELCRLVIDGQESADGEIILEGNLPAERIAPVSGRQSHDLVVVGAHCRQVGGRISTLRRLGMHHITACPCTQVYTGGALGVELPGGCPYPTHSQRAVTSLGVRPEGGTVTYDDLHAVLTDVLHVVQDLLKRSDETELVLAAHRHPQFAEDVVRQVALACGRRFGDHLDPATEVQIESRSLESIHIHDVICAIHTCLATILDTMTTAGLEAGGRR